MSNPQAKADANLNPSLKLALAIAILKSRRPPSSAVAADAANDAHSQPVFSNASQCDAIKWKRKAKQRKEEILRLKEALKLAEDGVHHDVFPEQMMCKCYFFDNFGEMNSNYACENESNHNRFSDVLRRRFLRQVRLSVQKRRDKNSSEKSCISEFCSENEIEQLAASVDFLVELCETSVRVEEGNFKNLSHQAVDFIHGTLTAILSSGNFIDAVESIVSSLIVRLIRRMCSGSNPDELNHHHNTFQLYVQHLLRKLGSDPYIGQRLILSVSHRISSVAGSLLFMDPFQSPFYKIHNYMYLMIQLVEFLVSDYLVLWSTNEDLDTKILEEWVTSIFHARKALELLENRNTLYALYMDRVVGNLTRRLGEGSLVHKMQPHFLTRLFAAQ